MERKKIIQIFLLVLFALICGRVVYRLFRNDRHDGVSEHNELERLRIQKLTKMPEPLRVVKAASYNFQRMIRLIDACAALKAESSVSFDLKRTTKKADRSLVMSLIQELLHERAQLREYIWELKGYSRAAIPSRKYRSLLYYLEVMDHNLADMRDLLHEPSGSPQYAQEA